MLWSKLSHSQSFSKKQIDDLYYDAKNEYWDGNYNKALNLFEKISRVAIKREDISDERRFKIYFWMGKSYGKLDYYFPALSRLDTSLFYAKKWHKQPHVELADIYLNQAIFQSSMMHFDASTKSNRQAIHLYQKLYGNESAAVATMYMHLGMNYVKQEEFEVAEKMLDKSLNLFKRTLKEGNKNWYRFYNNAGIFYRKKKDYGKALDYAQLALRYKLEHYEENHPSVAKYYSNLFRIYRDIGDWEQAIYWNKKDLEVCRHRFGENHPKYAGGLSELASIYLEMGQAKEAYNLWDKSQTINSDRLGQNHPYTLSGYSNKALCLRAQGDIDGAIEHIRKSMKGNQQNEATYFPHLFDDGIYLANLYKQKGDFKKAQHICDSLLGVLLQLNESHVTNDNREYQLLEINGLHERGHIKYLAAKGTDKQLLLSASQDLTTAVNLVDKTHRSVSFRESETAYLDESASLYEDAVASQIALYQLTNEEQYFDRALLFSEKSKATNLRKTINEKSARNLGDLPPRLVQQIIEIEDQINHLQVQIESTNSSLDVNSIQYQSFVDLQASRENWLAKLESEYPKYYNIKYGNEALDIDALQQTLSTNHQACVAYYLIDNVGYAFYLSEKSKQLVSFQWQQSQVDWISSLKDNSIAASAIKFNGSASNQLYNSLWSKIENALQKDEIKRIVISPHLELNFLAFDLLKKPNSSDHYLIEDVALSYTNSLQLDFKNTTSNKNRSSYVGFAPVFDYLEQSNTLLASRNDLDPLPSTIDEIKLGSKLFNGKSFIRNEANQTTFLASVNDAAIIHIASHATVQPNSIAQSGIHLHPDSASTDLINDDYLTIPEIYNLRLNADLVILSACHTGSGDLSISEGPMSMSRAFQYAGSKSVLMSQWRANDLSTASIVKTFLENIRIGKPKDVALQEAKIAYLKSADPLMAHPFFWAGLTLFGEADTFDVSHTNHTIWLWFLFAAIIAGVLYYLINRSRR